MEARPYKPEDFESIEMWGKMWGDDYSPELLPDTGFIVDGLAAYFMYETNSKLCFFENLISNKEADKQLVSKAADLCIEALFKLAKEKGFTAAQACTNNPKVILRAVSHGATINANHALITKTL